MAKQIELARAAGVSVSTVSRALSNSPGIGADLRVRIHKLAQELGYQRRGESVAPARVIRAYVTVNAVTGGLVPFYNAIAEGLAVAARAAGLVLEIRLIQESQFDPGRLDRDADEGTVTGTMLVGIDVTGEVAARLAATRHVVLVNTFDPLMRFDCVGPNNFYGGALATQQLLNAGHRSLLHIRDHLRPTTIQRHLGYRAAVEAQPGARGAVEDAPNASEALLHEIAQRRRAQITDWTGVYCVHDLAAIRLIHALEAVGFRVPSDLSVIGFDDLPAAAMMSPHLSTMKVDCKAIGAQAVALMLRGLADPECGPVQAECGITTVPGGTIAQIAQV